MRDADQECSRGYGDKKWRPIEEGIPRTPFRSYLENTLNQIGITLPDGTVVPLAEQLTRVLVTRALSGDTKAANLILERIDPAPKQAITVNTNVVTPNAVREEIKAGMHAALARLGADDVLIESIIADSDGRRSNGHNGKGNGKCAK